jgi:uncharacterized protein YlxP (DUF503 family)
VLVLTVELHLPASGSLKAKRAVIQSLAETCRRRYSVAVAETDHQETWQRAQLGVAIVSGAVGQCERVIDQVERYVWSVPEVEVLETQRTWLEPG